MEECSKKEFFGENFEPIVFTANFFISTHGKGGYMDVY